MGNRPDRDVELEYAYFEPDAKTSFKTKKARVRDPETGEMVWAYITEKTEYDEQFDKIEPLSNLDPVETETLKMYKTASNFTQFLSEQLEMDLSPAQQFITREGKGLAHSVKSRGGWLLNTLKADRRILETNEKIFSKMAADKAGWQWPWSKKGGDERGY